VRLNAPAQVLLWKTSKVFLTGQGLGGPSDDNTIPGAITNWASLLSTRLQGQECRSPQWIRTTPLSAVHVVAIPHERTVPRGTSFFARSVDSLVPQMLWRR